MARSVGAFALAPRGAAKRAVNFVMRGYGPAIVGIAATAFVGGLVEALFLITVTRTAFAISKAQSEIGILAGRHLSIGAALGVALALVVVRALMASYAN